MGRLYYERSPICAYRIAFYVSHHEFDHCQIGRRHGRRRRLPLFPWYGGPRSCFHYSIESDDGGTRTQGQWSWCHFSCDEQRAVGSVPHGRSPVCDCLQPRTLQHCGLSDGERWYQRCQRRMPYSRRRACPRRGIHPHHQTSHALEAALEPHWASRTSVHYFFFVSRLEYEHHGLVRPVIRPAQDTYMTDMFLSRVFAGEGSGKIETPTTPPFEGSLYHRSCDSNMQFAYQMVGTIYKPTSNSVRNLTARPNRITLKTRRLFRVSRKHPP